MTQQARDQLGGADHVSIQLLTAPGAGPADGYRQLAGALQLP